MVKEQLPNALIDIFDQYGEAVNELQAGKWMLFIWMNQLLLATQVKTQTLSLHLLT